MLKFAFCPTEDMHIGHLRIALLNSFLAKKRGEDFILLVENNFQNEKREKEQETIALLDLFSLQYKQVIYQNQNLKFYSAMALQLLHEKKAFSCFCSDEWLEKKRKEAEFEKKPYRYDDACRNLPAELVLDNTAPFVVRIASPIEVDGCKKLESFVIMNRDKTPTSDFASAVDDMLYDISTVVCLKKSNSNRVKEAYIREQLGYEKVVEYIYIASVPNEENFKVKELIEEGYLPDAILNYLISISIKTPNEIFTIENLIDSPAPFDIERLKDINRSHMKFMDATELSRYIGFADADIGELARLYIEDIATTKELKSKITSIFKDSVACFEEEDKDLRKVKESVKKAPYFEKYDDFVDHIKRETKLKEDKILLSLYILLTKSKSGPDIAKIYHCLKNYIGEIVK